MPNAGRVAPRSAPASGPNTASQPSSASRTRYDDSWVEISSRPSSSSLSSAAADEIVTTGLRVQCRAQGRHARRSFGGLLNRPVVTPRSRVSHSYHGRFEETESEDDQSSPSVLTGSPSSPQALSAHSESANGHNDGDNEEEEDDGDDDEDEQVAIGGESEDDDVDENATALGIAPYASVFTPQPNAFSHPPPAIQQLAPPHVRPDAHAHQSRHWRSPRQPSSHTTAQRPRHSPYDIISPAYQADHDAALRASLSTLLSCAAAARGLSKPAPRLPGGRATAGAAAADLEPTTLQMVPQSALLRTGPEPRGNAPVRQPSPASPAPPPPPPEVRSAFGRRTSSPGSSSRSGKGGKRKASPSRMAAAAGGVGFRSRSSSKDRATKKAKCSAQSGNDGPVVPSSLLTWVLSAGVVVLVSALSFSAGYVLGREVGRIEAGGGSSSLLDMGGISAGGSSSGGNTGGGSCGGEAVNGLRRLRWSSSGARVASV